MCHSFIFYQLNKNFVLWIISIVFLHTHLRSFAKLMLTGFVLALLGCQPENLNPQENAPQKADGARKELSTEGIKFNGEYLEFAHPQIFEKTLEILGASSPKVQKEWEMQFTGFVSLRNVYDQAILANQSYFKQINEEVKSTKIGKNDLRKFLKHSDFVQKNARALLLSKEENNFTLRPNLHDMRAFAVINADGIVKVGRYLFQYTKDQLKIMPATKKDKLSQFKQSLKDDPTNEIVVKSVRKEEGNKGGRAETYYMSQYSSSPWIKVHQGSGNFYTEVYRRITGGVSTSTNVEPIYENNSDGGPETPIENPPVIMGYRYDHYYDASVNSEETVNYYAYNEMYFSYTHNGANPYMTIQGDVSDPIGPIFRDQFNVYYIYYPRQESTVNTSYYITGSNTMTGGDGSAQSLSFSY